MNANAPRASWTRGYNTRANRMRSFFDAFYVGRIVEGYADIWKCSHQHGLAGEALSCAQQELYRRKTAT
jgi:hypothetical protein